jgi:hypothetical protein
LIPGLGGEDPLPAGTCYAIPGNHRWIGQASRFTIGRMAEGIRQLRGTSAIPVRPAAFCYGAGHLVVHGNADFRTLFGERAIGMPAREVLVDLPSEAFDLLDAVFRQGRPLARWIHRGADEWRLTAAPRIDPETHEVYGVLMHLRARSDLPVVARSANR